MTAAPLRPATSWPPTEYADLVRWFNNNHDWETLLTGAGWEPGHTCDEGECIELGETAHQHWAPPDAGSPCAWLWLPDGPLAARSAIQWRSGEAVREPSGMPPLGHTGRRSTATDGTHVTAYSRFTFWAGTYHGSIMGGCRALRELAAR